MGKKLNFVVYGENGSRLADNVSLTLRQAITLAKASNLSFVYVYIYRYHGSFRNVDIYVSENYVSFTCRDFGVEDDFFHKSHYVR